MMSTFSAHGLPSPTRELLIGEGPFPPSAHGLPRPQRHRRYVTARLSQ